MMFNQVDLYYFSGTGNTRCIVKKMKEVFVSQKVKVEWRRIEDGFGGVFSGDVMTGLAFPANTQSVSPFVWKFIKALPDGRGTKAFVILTLNESAAVLSSVYRLLKKKNYDPFYAKEISMPNNMLAEKSRTGDERLHEGLKAAVRCAEEILMEKRSWDENRKGSGLVSALSGKTGLPRMAMRMMTRLKTDHSKYTGCGVCVTNCPVNNISDGRRHGGKCEFCMRCAANCPVRAISVKGRDGMTIRKCGE